MMSTNNSPKLTDEQRLADLVVSCAEDPLAFVHCLFPWGTGELADHRGPDKWQAELLAAIRDKLLSAELVIRFAMASGHGIGKSAITSWLILWALATMKDTRGVVTANTSAQLKSKSWAELAKWHRLCFCGSWFELTATAIYARDPKHRGTWRIDAIAWSESNTEAFAGLHNQGKRIVVLMDEASAIPDAIHEVVEGAMTDKDTQILWAMFGNPTRNTGRFREAFAGGRFEHRWQQWQIDSRTARMTDKTQIDEWIRDYGIDSDFCRVRVLGEFPRAGSMQFIGSELVKAAACDRDVHVDLNDPFIMGVDVARFGDDKTVIRFRRGLDARSIKPVKLIGKDTMQVAQAIAELNERWQPDAIFIDAGGPGAGVVDRCLYLKLPVTGVDFGAEADPILAGPGAGVAFYNQRARMWFLMREWLAHGQIDEDRELAADLTAPEYGFAMKRGKDCILLEKKERMRRRGLASPDDADALCITFFARVAKSRHRFPYGAAVRGGSHQSEYDPLPFGGEPADGLRLGRRRDMLGEY